jgi:type I restriction enzyme S subunit
MELINQSLNIKKLQDITLDMHQGINTVTEKVEYLQEGIPILQSKHITKGFLNINDTKYLSESDYFKYKEKYQAKIDDLLICNIGTIGSSLRIEKEERFLIAWNLFLVKLNKDLVYSGYLAHYFNYLKSKNYFDRFLTGGTVKFINKKTMQKIPVPLPKLENQKKIAAILDEADKVRQLNKQLITKYDALTQSLFLEMFGDPVTNPKGWETKTIEQIVKKEKYSLKRGPFGGALKKDCFVEKGYLVYEQYHALNNDFSFERYYIDEKKYKELKAFDVRPRDLIISCSGVYLGKLAMIPENAKQGIINQALLKVTLDEEKMRNDFFIFHFTQKRFRETFFDANRGAGIPNFPPMKEFKRFPFISPPIDIQNQFAERVQIIENQKQQALDSLQKSEDLFNSLLQKAFKGELVK